MGLNACCRHAFRTVPAFDPPSAIANPPCPPFSKGGKQKLSTRGASPPLKRGLRGDLLLSTGICSCVQGIRFWTSFARSQRANATDRFRNFEPARWLPRRSSAEQAHAIAPRRGASPAFASPLWKRGAGGICSCLRRFALGLHSRGINAPTPRTDLAISSQMHGGGPKAALRKKMCNRYGKRQGFRSSAWRVDARRRRPWPDAGSPDACRSGSWRCRRDPAVPARRAGRRRIPARGWRRNAAADADGRA